MKHLYTLFFVLICTQSFTAKAQQFQWVRGGGTNESSPTLDNHPEGVNYMCTDRNGNIYAVSNVGNNAVIADSFYTTSGLGLDRNILITSYNCSGQMRWAKEITSSAGQSYAFGIVADSAGHIYVGGIMPNGVLRIGYDTTIYGAHNFVLGLAQFDTNGHFNWLSDAGSNSSASYYATNSNYGALTIDYSSNVHLLAYLGAGAVLTSSVTSHQGCYDMKYNSLGALLSATKLDIDSTLLIKTATIDKQSNKLYALGYRGSTWTGFGGDSSAYNFVAAFDSNSNKIWIDTFGTSYDGEDLINGVVADGQGHLYITANGLTYVIYQGDTIHSSSSAFSWYMSSIIKTDTSGHMLWATHIDGTSDNFLGAVTLLQNDKVTAIGKYDVSINYDTITLNNPTPGGDPFFTVVDTGGRLLTLKGIHGDGYMDYGYAIATDVNGSIYMGGAVEDSIPDNTIPAYYSVGGNTDFFVLKYGLPCGCTTTPIASFTTSGTTAINYTYTGTMTGLDSVVWHYGDGNAGTGLTSTHGYTLSGTYHVCAYAYTECGVDSSCSDISVIGLGINDPVTAKISVYPNPATDELNVTDMINKTTYRVIDVTGTSVLQGAFEQTKGIISLNGFGAGIYVLELTGANGLRNNFKVCKE